MRGQRPDARHLGQQVGLVDRVAVVLVARVARRSVSGRRCVGDAGAAIETQRAVDVQDHTGLDGARQEDPDALVAVRRIDLQPVEQAERQLVLDVGDLDPGAEDRHQVETLRAELRGELLEQRVVQRVVRRAQGEEHSGGAIHRGGGDERLGLQVEDPDNPVRRPLVRLVEDHQARFAARCRITRDCSGGEAGREVRDTGSRVARQQERAVQGVERLALRECPGRSASSSRRSRT